MNNDLISRSAALNATKMVYIECIYVDELGYEETEADNKDVVFKSDIEAIPAVDAVEVVRCKDCVYKDSWYETEEYGVAFYICGCSGMHIVEDNDFCSYGERKENETN